MLRNQLEKLGVERMLQHLEIVVEYQSHEELVEAVGAVARDESAILIVALREIDESAGSVLRSAPELGAKTLILFDDSDVTQLSRLTGIERSGFLSTRRLSVRTLHQTLERMHGGDAPIPSQLARRMLTVASERTAASPRVLVRMTRREQEVLVLLVEGLSNKEIARRLRISEHGAKRHVANILAKLDCSNRTLAVAKALREGLYEGSLPVAGPSPAD